MRPANLFQVELASALATPRKAGLRLGLSFLLGAPFILAQMPVRVRVVGLILLALFHSFFGAAVGRVRVRALGRETKLALLPLPGWLILLDRLLAGVVVDLIQTGPLLLLLVAVHGSPGLGPALPSLAWLFCGTLLVLNLLGQGLGRLAKSNAEVHLGGALGVGLVAFLSGLIPTPGPLAGLLKPVWGLSPVRGLAEALEGALLGPAPSGGVWPVVFLAGLAVLYLWRALER